MFIWKRSIIENIISVSYIVYYDIQKRNERRSKRSKSLLNEIHTRKKQSASRNMHRLMTVTTALIRRELGELSPQMQDEVANKLRKLFGLA